MAGSMMWFDYVADSGAVYGVKLDESNAKAAGFSPYIGTGDNKHTQLPRGTTMRYANVQQGVIKRRIYLPTITSDLWTGAIDTVNLPDFQSSPGGIVTSPAGAAFVVTSLVGERVKRPIPGDSGLTDGTPNG
jgi:hypothetical protein